MIFFGDSNLSGSSQGSSWGGEASLLAHHSVRILLTVARHESNPARFYIVGLLMVGLLVRPTDPFLVGNDRLDEQNVVCKLSTLIILQ